MLETPFNRLAASGAAGNGFLALHPSGLSWPGSKASRATVSQPAMPQLLVRAIGQRVDDGSRRIALAQRKTDAAALDALFSAQSRKEPAMFGYVIPIRARGGSLPRVRAQYHRDIDAALEYGALSRARALAEEGFRRYPEDDRLRRAAIVLALPRLLSTTPPTGPGPAADRAWIIRNRTAFAGRWVALRAGEFVADAPTLAELVERFGGPAEDVLLTKVW